MGSQTFYEKELYRLEIKYYKNSLYFHRIIPVKIPCRILEFHDREGGIQYE